MSEPAREFDGTYDAYKAGVRDGIEIGKRLVASEVAALREAIEDIGERWETATGHKSIEDAERQARRQRTMPFAGGWEVHGGVLRYVRSYPNGRRGYYVTRDLFVDVPK